MRRSKYVLSLTDTSVSRTTRATFPVTTRLSSFCSRFTACTFALVFLRLASLSDPLLLIALFILVGGFAAINRFAPEPMQVGNHLVTQKSLYAILVVVVLVLLWFAQPFALIFWLVGSSALLILGHAAFIEPPVSSEYAGVESV